MQSDEYKEISRKLGLLETHLINLIVPIQGISGALSDKTLMYDLRKIFGNPLKIDDRALSVLIREFREAVNVFRKDLESINLKQTFDEIKYIGNRLKGLEEKVADIRKEQKNKEVRLKVCVEGQERDHNDKIIRSPLIKLLNILPETSQKIVIHRAGICGQEPKTFKEIARILKIPHERASREYKRSLVRLRQTDTEELIEQISEKDREAMGI